MTLTATDLSSRVLAWYTTAGRDLPWRKTRDPYQVLVSEMMLQQTQVDRVIPHWLAWVERWPTAAGLAVAPRAEVIAAWQGLGYNRRAVALHIAARMLAEDGVPTDIAGWQRLPGVGPYTAAAVCALALDHDIIPVDVNVQRILERALGERMIDPPPGRACDLTQALFDLGASVCLARIPRCHACPLVDACPSRGMRFAAQRKQSRFEGSRRQARGRLLNELREGAIDRGKYSIEIAQSLVDDGLAEFHQERLRLPST